MQKFRFCALLLAFMPLLSHAGLFDDKEARKQITETQQSLERLQQSMQQNDQLISDRITQTETAVKGLKLTDVLNQLETLRNEVASLRGQFELQTYQMEQLQKRQKDLYNDIDTRVRALEDNRSALKTEAVPDKTAGDDAAYSAALDAYKRADYAAAASGFQNFAASFPENKLAPNALYWNGAALYAQKNCAGATVTYQKLLAQYPDSSKTPDALLGIATCQQEKKDTLAARKTLQQLLTRFPATPAGEQAKKQLAQIGASGKK